MCFWSCFWGKWVRLDNRRRHCVARMLLVIFSVWWTLLFSRVMTALWICTGYKCCTSSQHHAGSSCSPHHLHPLHPHWHTPNKHNAIGDLSCHLLWQRNDSWTRRTEHKHKAQQRDKWSTQQQQQPAEEQDEREKNAQTLSEAAEPWRLGDCFPFYSPLCLLSSSPSPLSSSLLSLCCVYVRVCVCVCVWESEWVSECECMWVSEQLPPLLPLSCSAQAVLRKWMGAHRELLYLQMTYPESHDPLNVGWAGGWRLHKQREDNIL